MITRDEIRKIPELHKLIERKTEQLRYLQEKATAVPSGLSEGERVQTSPSNTAGKYSDAAADLNREIRQDQLELAELQSRVSLFIETLPTDTETQRLTVKVMRYRYIKCYHWWEVSEFLGYDERWIRRMEAQCISDL